MDLCNGDIKYSFIGLIFSGTKAGQGDASHKVLVGAGALLFRNVMSILKMDNYSGFFKEKMDFSISGENISNII